MNIGFFGGTFDPIHRGHLAVASAAAGRFRLQKILFVLNDVSPHKQQEPITPYVHRYAMLALALAGEPRYLPSTLESPGVAVHYSIDTVRRAKKDLKKSDRLFFIIGMDAFREISTWRQPEQLLRECEFIVASRPGHSLAEVADALPDRLRPPDKIVAPFRRSKAGGTFTHKGVTIHLLPEVNDTVSATEIRAAAQARRSLGGRVPATVASYIRKMHLYEEE
jgi:nicotinate-nucleotide adenylyltransferase